MSASKKTLTVSYGKFSCKITGFDNPADVLDQVMDVWERRRGTGVLFNDEPLTFHGPAQPATTQNKPPSTDPKNNLLLSIRQFGKPVFTRKDLAQYLHPDQPDSALSDREEHSFVALLSLGRILRLGQDRFILSDSAST